MSADGFSFFLTEIPFVCNFLQKHLLFKALSCCVQAPNPFQETYQLDKIHVVPAQYWKVGFFVISRSNKSNSAFLKVKWSYKEFFHSHHSLQTALLFSQIPAAIQITKYEAFLNMWVIFKAAKTLWKVFIKETKIEICSREIMSDDSS